MALILTGKCGSCAASMPMLPDSYLAVRTRLGEIVQLPHPGEFDHLRQLGFTFEQAKAERRLLRFHHFACDGCGRVTPMDESDPRYPHDTRPWLFYLYLLAFAIAGMLFTVLHDVAWYWRVLIAPGYAIFGVMAAFWLALRVGEIRDRFQRGLPKSDVRCDQCDAGRLHHVAGVSRFPVPCASCGARAVTFETALIS